MIKPGSQNDLISQHFKRGGSLTHLSAYNLFRCMRLAARVVDLRREGLQIKSERVWLPEKGVHIANYYL